MIDWTRVQTLRDDIGDDDFTEVVAMFLAEAEEVIERLKTSPDASRLEHDLHFLKSSALNLGLRQMSALCQEGEMRAAAGKGGDSDLAQVFAVWAASRAALLEGQRMNSPMSSSSVTSV